MHYAWEQIVPSKTNVVGHNGTYPTTQAGGLNQPTTTKQNHVLISHSNHNTMNKKQIERKIEQLKADLREAKLRGQWMQIGDIVNELNELEQQMVEVQRTAYSELARKEMTDKEITQFAADLIELNIIASVAEDIGLRVAGHLRRWKDFDSPALNKFQNAVKTMSSVTNMINETSKTHPIQDENGRVYTLNEHFGNMVDEVETYILGMQNVIHRVVNKSVNFND